MSATWQLDFLAGLTERASVHASVAKMSVFGSALTPESLDAWSDVDVELVLTGPVAVASLLPDDATVWAVDHHSADDASTSRIVLTDGRRIDLVVRGAGRLDLGPLPSDAVANEARFVAALAVAKAGRGDLLIASHLTLELAKTCLVQAMLLRDRDEGTTTHRFGTGRDALAIEIWSALGAAEDRMASPLRGIEALVVQFDRLHSELDDTYIPDWSGLRELGSWPARTS